MTIGIAAFVVLIYVTTETLGVVEQSKYCGIYWRVHDGICYSKNFERGTMSDVQRDCEWFHSKVVTIKSAKQLCRREKFIQTLSEYDRRVWVDLYRRTEGASPGWYWADGTRFVPKILKWNKGFESIYDSSAFALTTQGTLVPINRWGNNGYICEVKSTDQKCPKNYKLSGDTCYFFSDLSQVAHMKYSVYRASRSCKAKANGSHLLEIRSQKKMVGDGNVIFRYRNDHDIVVSS